MYLGALHLICASLWWPSPTNASLVVYLYFLFHVTLEIPVPFLRSWTLMILLDPFQLRIFCDSMRQALSKTDLHSSGKKYLVLWTAPSCFSGSFLSSNCHYQATCTLTLQKVSSYKTCWGRPELTSLDFVWFVFNHCPEQTSELSLMANWQELLFFLSWPKAERKQHISFKKNPQLTLYKLCISHYYGFWKINIKN